MQKFSKPFNALPRDMFMLLSTDKFLVLFVPAHERGMVSSGIRVKAVLINSRIRKLLKLAKMDLFFSLLLPSNITLSS